MKANIIGTGLIGASIGLGLKQNGWEIFGEDIDKKRLAQATDLGFLSNEKIAKDADITFIATPVEEIVEAAQYALKNTTGIVTDVGSVKAPILKEISDSRFVGGHPMAGNELDGILGAKADLFENAVWVLTPSEETSDETYSKISDTIKMLGVEVVALPAAEHDRLVAVVSHVPHLTAGALMRLALGQSQTKSVLMRLAAGGFRDMTRIASGNPDIWIDICEQNKEAICEYLDVLITELEKTKDIIANSDQQSLLSDLSAARKARISLPVGTSMPENLAEIRVAIPDKPGSVAEIATLASQLNVNIYDLEIAHKAEGELGTMILVVDNSVKESFAKKLKDAKYSVSSQSLG